MIAAHSWRRELRLVDQAGATNCPRIPTSTLPLPRQSFAVECTLLAHTLVAIACVHFCYTLHQDTVFFKRGSSNSSSAANHQLEISPIGPNRYEDIADFSARNEVLHRNLFYHRCDKFTSRRYGRLAEAVPRTIRFPE